MTRSRRRKLVRMAVAKGARSVVTALPLASIAIASMRAASAQDAQVSSTPELEEVIVTAQKRSENIQDVPIAIQAFTSKAIADLGIKASTDLSQFAPNVDIALPAGAGNQPIITIRGVGLNDYDTNNAGPNGVYADEVYLSSPASQTFQAFDLDRGPNEIFADKIKRSRHAQHAHGETDSAAGHVLDRFLDALVDVVRRDNATGR